MNDKERTLKALEDMKESMAYAVRRKQQIGHEAVPIVSGGASTQDRGTALDDTQLTELCADAMGLDTYAPGKSTHMFDRASWERLKHTRFYGDGEIYDPLYDDEQAMALVKKLRLSMETIEVGAWYVWNEEDCKKYSRDVYAGRFDDNLNRAIVGCVAKMQLDRAARETSTVAQDK